MPTLPNSSTLLDRVQNELRIPVSNLTERAKISAVVSFVYGDICAKSDWWWLVRQGVVNTTPRIDAGTVALTENGTTATFSTAPQQFSANVSVAGYVLLVTGATQDPQAAYRITAHISGSVTATLDAGFTGTTDSYSYRLHQQAIPLPTDCAKLLHVKRYGYQHPLERLGIEDLSYLLQSNWGEGHPSCYSIYDFATAGDVSTQRLLQFAPYTDRAYRLELHYKHEQAGDFTTDCSLPNDYHQVLVYGTLARAYPIFLNDLERGQYYQSLFNDVMALMAAQQREYASDHPGVAPEMRGYRRTTNRGRAGGSLGRLFDVWPYSP